MQEDEKPEVDVAVSRSKVEADLSAAIARAVNAIDRYHYAKDFGSSEAVLNVLRTEVEQALKVFNIAYSCSRQDGLFVE